MELVFADSIRDGGSIYACFESGGRNLSLWLMIEPWDEPGDQKSYGALHFSEDFFPEHGPVVSLGSAEEQEIFARLDGWLSLPILSTRILEPRYPGQTEEQRKHHLIGLVATLRAAAGGRLG